MMTAKRILEQLLLIDLILWSCYVVSSNACPSPETILPCRCAQKENEVQIWCSHSTLPQVIEGIRSVATIVKRPIDELILENNQLPALPGRFFASMQVTRLMLRHNSLERLSTGWLNELEDNLVEIFIVEHDLRSVPIESLIGFNRLEAVTIHSDILKRPPNFSGLLNLKYISIQSAEIIELQPHFFRLLPLLDTIKISGGRNLNRIEAGLFENLPSLETLDLSRNGINWMHLRAMYRLPKLESLRLSSNQITDVGMVGRAIKDLENLQKLRLDRNFISILGEGSFVDLPMLREIHLNENRITEIHYGAFHKTPNLRVIYLQDNIVKRIHPESFLQSSGSGVEQLYIQHNEIDRIQELRSLLDALPTLKFLDMSNNYLVDIPFGALRGHGTIEQMYLDNNLIRIIDKDALMAMPALRELRLKNNSLSDSQAMPFWNLPGLKGLDLSINNFRKVDTLLLAGIPSLRRLDMSQNFITTIDSLSFFHVPMLETLNVSFNEITFIHPGAFRNLNRLFEIDASNNLLQQTIQDLPTIIERVSLRSNRIAEFQSSKSLHLPNLRMLDLSYNQLEQVPNLSLQYLKQLRVLSLARNKIRSIEDSTFMGPNRLELLHLQDNEISDIHDYSLQSMSSLRDLNLRNNKLETLSDTIFMNNSYVEQLDLSRNSLRDLSPTIFKNMKSLRYLDISGNYLSEIPSSLSLLTKLRDIDMSSNRLISLPPSIVSTWKNVMEIRVANNQITELKQGAVRNLPKLQYLDLSSNELNSIERGALRNLPDLQELVLADNKLVELKDHVFEELPDLQAAHFQHNLLRYISPNSFYKSPSLLYLNLSSNQFYNLDNIGLRNMRNLEVLDLSNNNVKKITTMPLQALNWLVELKLDDNQICKVQGEPFTVMPRLRVLSMRNNRMKTMTEKTFRNLRTNIAILDVDGNPISCSCDLMWLRVWLDESNSHSPGPKCPNGKFLRSEPIENAECGNYSHIERIPLINEHGDIFTRELGDALDDDCDREFPDAYPQKPSPVESELFYDQYIDYAFNDTTHSKRVNTTNTIKRVPSAFVEVEKNIPPKNTVLNYNLYHRPRPPPPSSPFTFFGYPIPALNVGKFFGPGRSVNGRPPTHSADARFRMYRPTQQDLESYLGQGTRFQDTSTRNRMPASMDDRGENGDDHHTFHTSFSSPSVENGGFTPMIPDTFKGFVPITDPTRYDSAEDIRSTSKPTVSTTIVDQNVAHLDNASPTQKPISETTTSHIVNPTIPYQTEDNHVSELNDQRFTPPSVAESSTPPQTMQSADENFLTDRIETVTEVSKHKDSTPFTTPSHDTEDVTDTSERFRDISPTTDSKPILLIPPSNEAEENYRREHNKFWESINHSSSSLSALVAPGSQQPKQPPRPALGRSTITKVLTPHIPNLPTAEEFLRTTAAIESQNHFDSFDYVTSAPEAQQVLKKEGMDWYYENYGIRRKSDFKSSNGATVLRCTHTMDSGKILLYSVSLLIYFQRILYE